MPKIMDHPLVGETLHKTFVSGEYRYMQAEQLREVQARRLDGPSQIQASGNEVYLFEDKNGYNWSSRWGVLSVRADGRMTVNFLGSYQEWYPD